VSTSESISGSESVSTSESVSGSESVSTSESESGSEKKNHQHSSDPALPNTGTEDNNNTAIIGLGLLATATVAKMSKKNKRKK
ncbi:LPXTG cell wall anchor domain-containing protein, partial [Leuconostoc suionicum]|uniref:LPXTG cell wall anchor domain-containing protein n=1 Tax=Leuconostoc suionicum TaxID=1511761 RepID=UPI0040356ABA